MTPLTAPGPSPWYLRAPWARIVTPAGNCSWESYDDPALSGLSRLALPNGDTILFVDFCCYLQHLDNSALLVWYEAEQRIVFTLLDLAKLEVLVNARGLAAEVRSRKCMLHFKGGEPTVWEFVTAVAEGHHDIAPPDRFRGVPEVLALADFAGGKTDHFRTAHRAIFAFDFRAGRVHVMPQKWFNDGNYDFGYQWITRVQRDAATGRIVGEGIRLGVFLLDERGTAIDRWLHEDVFYHPEGQFRS